jgi:hypothetical protein
MGIRSPTGLVITKGTTRIELHAPFTLEGSLSFARLLRLKLLNASISADSIDSGFSDHDRRIGVIFGEEAASEPPKPPPPTDTTSDLRTALNEVIDTHLKKIQSL